MEVSLISLDLPVLQLIRHVLEPYLIMVTFVNLGVTDDALSNKARSHVLLTQAPGPEHEHSMVNVFYSIR